MPEVGEADDRVRVARRLVISKRGLEPLQYQVLTLRDEAIAETQLLKAAPQRGLDGGFLLPDAPLAVQGPFPGSEPTTTPQPICA